MVTMKTAVAKVSLAPLSALILGVFCNFLVCVAVWIAAGGNSVTEKLASVYLPIFLFVVCGFEHSVANMYYIPAGIFAAGDPVYAAAAAAKGIDTSILTWGNFFINNLIPVTIGNIIGGCILVGAVYKKCYPKKKA